MAAREEPDVLLKCGHWANSLGALHVLGSSLGKLEIWCERCGAWQDVKPRRKKKTRLPDKPLF